MNNRRKSYETNGKVRKYLFNNNYTNIFFFPHLRFQKDYNLEGLSFDGICTRNNKINLIQIKTNVKPTKKLIESYRNVAKKYGINCLYISLIKKGVIVWE